MLSHFYYFTEAAIAVLTLTDFINNYPYLHVQLNNISVYLQMLWHLAITNYEPCALNTISDIKNVVAFGQTNYRGIYILIASMTFQKLWSLVTKQYSNLSDLVIITIEYI